MAGKKAMTPQQKRADAKLDAMETKAGGRGKQSPAQARADAKLDRMEPTPAVRGGGSGNPFAAFLKKKGGRGRK